MLSRLVAWIGALQVAHWEVHERERALQRFVVCMAIGLPGSCKSRPSGSQLALWTYGSGLVYGLLSFWYRQSLKQPKPGQVVALCALIIDPVFLLLAMAADPATFVFLVPLVMIAIVGPGMRFGSRALNLTLALSALTVAGMFALGDFWRREIQWSAALVLSLLLVPIFFRTQIRRIHDVRRIEEERASLSAKSAAVLERAVFLSKVSHELRSPLQSMVSSLDVFEMRHLDAARGDVE